VQEPLLHVPEQQSASLEHTLPLGAHWQAPLMQLPEQQSLPVLHVPPAAAQAHAPPVHAPEQQSPSPLHAIPRAAQAHVPFWQLPEQHSASSPQSAPTAAQTQAPFWQLPEQHSSPPWQVLPAGVQAHVPPETMPEQQPVGPWPGKVQQVPVPPQVRPGSHCAVAVHAIPFDEAHAKLPVEVPQQTESQLASTHAQFAGFCWQALSGSLQSLRAVALPEQHASGEVGSVSGPTQEQTPPLHRPEMHAWASVQAAPFGSEPVAQAPASQ